MSEDGEPIAKRTRRSALNSKLELLSSIRELQKKINENNEKILARYNEVIQYACSMNGIEKTMRKHAMECKCSCKCDCKRKVIEMEHRNKEMSDKLRVIRMKLFDSHQVAASLLLEHLHPLNCNESDDCLLSMHRMLVQDPLCLERKRELDPFPSYGGIDCEYRHSPLHDAVSRGHVKCVKFLLERGANVTSITTSEQNTVLQTLYTNYIKSEDRLEILKLLLKYGVSRVFHHNQAGEYALSEASTHFCVEEVSLLLQNGARMSQQELRTTLATVWKMYDLRVIKQLSLHHPRIILGSGSFHICLLLVKYCYKQMVLPGVPLDECHRKLLEALQLYKVLGGKFHGKFGSVKSLLQYLKVYKHKRHFREVRESIKALVSNSLSLKEISRLAIHKYIPTDYVESVKQLEVPVDLQPFLRFDDVTLTDLPSDYEESDDMYTSSEGDSDSSDSEF